MESTTLHHVAEGQLRHTDAAVLADIMEQDGSYYRIVPDTHADSITGRGQRLDDIGLAGFTQLTDVLLPGKTLDIGVHYFVILNGNTHAFFLL